MRGLTLKNISKAYGTTPVLRDVSLTVAEGEFVTLLGPSGCGKSTLLRIVAGLEPQDSGAVVIGDRIADALRPKHRDVAMVFQSYALYPHMTVADNLAVPLRMRRLSSWQRMPLIGRLLPGTGQTDDEITAEVARTAKALSIDHLLGRKPGQLSGGQRQRVAVGRALVRHPAVFLMDEPLSNLDAALRVQMRAEIKDLHRRLGATFVYVTHDQVEAMTLSDRVAVMADGDLLQVAPPHDIYADPDDARVAEFVGSPKINMISAMPRVGGWGEVAAFSLPIPAERAHGPLTLGIRPEAFHLAEHGGPGVLTGIVRLIEHMGSDLFAHVDVAGHPEPLIARLLAERSPHVRPGQTLHLGVRSDRILLFDTNGRRLRATGSVAPLREYA